MERTRTAWTGRGRTTMDDSVGGVATRAIKVAISYHTYVRPSTPGHGSNRSGKVGGRPGRAAVHGEREAAKERAGRGG